MTSQKCILLYSTIATFFGIGGALIVLPVIKKLISKTIIEFANSVVVTKALNLLLKTIDVILIVFLASFSFVLPAFFLFLTDSIGYFKIIEIYVSFYDENISFVLLGFFIGLLLFVFAVFVKSEKLRIFFTILYSISTFFLFSKILIFWILLGIISSGFFGAIWMADVSYKVFNRNKTKLLDRVKSGLNIGRVESIAPYLSCVSIICNIIINHLLATNLICK